MSYNTPQELWRSLGADAYTKVRNEIVGTGNGSAVVFSLDHDNVISSSEVVYTNGTAVTSGISLNYDDGKITFSSAPSSGITISADYDYGDIPNSEIQEILNRANEELVLFTGRNFESGSTSEYLDVEDGQTEFFLNNYPVITISSVKVNTASSVTDTPAWSSSTEGLGNDYIADLDWGRIRFIDNYPPKGERRIEVSYTYGYSSVPSLAKELEILLATRKMINSAVYKAIFKGQDGFTPVRLEEIENRIGELTRALRKQNISKI